MSGNKANKSADPMRSPLMVRHLKKIAALFFLLTFSLGESLLALCLFLSRLLGLSLLDLLDPVLFILSLFIFRPLLLSLNLVQP